MTEEKVFKNYEIFSNQIKIAKKNNKFQLLEVDRIDNNFLVKKNEIKTNPFDENYFVYFNYFLNLKAIMGLLRKHIHN